jgi:hypothetical protein
MVTAVCPNGHEVEPLPVVYGLPLPETVEQAGRGELKLGGCVVVDGQATTVCPVCEATVEMREPLGIDR